MANGAIGDVNEEDDRKEELLKEEGGSQAEDEPDEVAEFGLSLPVDVLKTWIRNVTHHEEGNRQHEGGNQYR